MQIFPSQKWKENNASFIKCRGQLRRLSMAIPAIVRYAAPYKAFFNALKCQKTAVLICRAQSCKTIVLKLFLLSVGFIH